MLDTLRALLTRWLRLTPGPPETPGGEHPEVFRASEKHLQYLTALWALTTALSALPFLTMGVVATVALVKEGHATVAVVIDAVLAAAVASFSFFSYASVRLDWEMRWYVLTDRCLRIREGIVMSREITLTLANVQELRASQGPLQRLLDLTDIVVDTAGGGGGKSEAGGSVHGHQGVLRGVDRGSDLRQRIEARVKQSRGTGLGDPDDDADTFLGALRQVRDEAKKLRQAAR